MNSRRLILVFRGKKARTLTALVSTAILAVVGFWAVATECGAVITFDLLHETEKTRELLKEELGASALSPQEAIPSGTTATARGDLESIWFAREKYLQIGEAEKAQHELQLLWEKAVEHGIRNLPEYGAVLVREAQRRLQTRDYDQAMRALGFARKIAPDELAVYTTAAVLALKRNPFNLAAVWEELVQAARAVGRSFRLQAWLGANLWFTITAGLTFFLAFTVGTYLVSVAPRLAHDLREALPFGSPRARVILSWLALGTPALLGFSPWWWLILGGLLMWPYLDRAPRALLAAGGLFVLALPWIVRESAIYLTLPSHQVLDKITLVREGHWTPGDYRELKALAEKGGGGAPAVTMLGIAARRLGLLNEAEAATREGLRAAPNDPVLWNNLGNVALARQDVAGAEESYRKATEIAPQAFVPHYNLGLAYREEFKFAEGEAESRRAGEIDPEAMAFYAGLDTARLKGHTVDSLPATGDLWKLARARSDEQDAAVDYLWESLMIGPAPGAWLMVAVLLLALGAAAGLWRLRGGVALACERCGRIFCGRCQTGKRGALCSQCHHIFVKKEGVDAKVRVEKMAGIKTRRRFLKIRHLVFAALAPGGGHLSAGRFWTGVAFLFPAAFFEARVLLGRGVFLSPWSLGSAAMSWFTTGAAVVFGLWWALSLWLASRLEE